MTVSDVEDVAGLFEACFRKGWGLEVELVDGGTGVCCR